MGFSVSGLDILTALSGALTAVANVGPGIGPIIGPAGNFAGLDDPEKVLLLLGMYLGRLEISGGDQGTRREARGNPNGAGALRQAGKGGQAQAYVG